MNVKQADNEAATFSADLGNHAAGTFVTGANGLFAGVQKHVGGWTRVWVGFNSSSGAAVPNVDLSIAEGDQDEALAGTVTGQGIYHDAWQIELARGRTAPLSFSEG